MERAGVHVNKDKLSEMATYLNKHIDSLQEAIFKECKQTFNLNSPKQLGEVLFDKLASTPPQKKGVTATLQAHLY